MQRLGPNRIAKVHVDADVEPCSPQHTDKLYPNTHIVVGFSNDGGTDGFGVKNNTIFQFDPGDESDTFFDLGHVVGHTGCLNIDVSGWSPRRKRGEEHTTLENKIVSVWGVSDPAKQRFKNVECLQFLHIRTGFSRELLNRESSVPYRSSVLR